MAVLNLAGTFDKKHITIAIALEMLKYGNCQILTNNPMYRFLTPNRDSQFSYGGIDIFYINDFSSVDLTNQLQLYKNSIIDTFDLFKNGVDKQIYVFDDISYKPVISSKEVVTIHYTAMDEAFEDADIVQPKEYSDEINFFDIMDTIECSDAKQDLLKEVMSEITGYKKSEYANSLVD